MVYYETLNSLENRMLPVGIWVTELCFKVSIFSITHLILRLRVRLPSHARYIETDFFHEMKNCMMDF